MTYGSDGEEEPRKTFSKVGYVLDKERKKSSDVDEGTIFGSALCVLYFLYVVDIFRKTK